MGNQIDKVLPGLFLGGFLGSDRKQKLQDNKMTHVLSIHDNAEPEFTDLFTYKCVRISDTSSSDLSLYFSECVDFIHNCRTEGGSVFVHCAAGISRSVTITVMYMMTVSDYSFEKCLLAVRQCREVANPNFGFRMQLQKYAEGKLKKERLRVLRQYPSTAKLGDNSSIEQLLKAAKEKGKEAAEDPYPIRYDTFEGGKGRKGKVERVEKEEGERDAERDKHDKFVAKKKD